MGTCKYCGQKAGFLKSKHKECEDKYKNGKSEIIKLVESAIAETSDFNKLKSDIEKISNESFIKQEELEGLYVAGFDNVLEIFLDDDILSEEEEERIRVFRDFFNFNQDVLDKNGSLQKVVKASIIREITEGKIPENRIQIQGALPFNLQKSEKLIWMFQNVELYEQRTRREFRGSHSGVNIRIAKGLYYRTGGFRGHPVQVEEMKYIDNGVFAITNKHVYFASSSKNFRIKFDKILKAEPYEDGIGLQKDTASAKPQIFKGIDGWFAYNAITNLTQI